MQVSEFYDGPFFEFERILIGAIEDGSTYALKRDLRLLADKLSDEDDYSVKSAHCFDHVAESGMSLAVHYMLLKPEEMFPTLTLLNSMIHVSATSYANLTILELQGIHANDSQAFKTLLIRAIEVITNLKLKHLLDISYSDVFDDNDDQLSTLRLYMR